MTIKRIISEDVYASGYRMMLVEIEKDTLETENIFLQFDHSPDESEILEAAQRTLQNKVVIHPWLEMTAIRIYLSNEAVIALLMQAKPLVDFVFNSGLTIEQCEGGSYVYVNFILDEHRAILTGAGGIIENRE